MFLQYLLDILVIVLAIAGVAIGIHQGFFKLFFARFKRLTSAFFALLIAKPFARLLTANWLSEKLSNWVFNLSKLTELEPAESAEALLASVPWFIRFMADSLGYDLTVAANEAFQSGNGMYHTIITDLTYPLASLISFIICSAILYFIIRGVIKLLVHFADGIFDLPVISTINKVIGAVFGVFVNFIILWIICKILGGITSIDAVANSSALANFDIQNTFIAKYVYNFNPIAFLLSLKQ